MNVISSSHDSMQLTKLFAERNWPLLARTAANLAARQPGNGEAFRYWGIGEFMQKPAQAHVDKLLRASQLNDRDADLWLNILQEFTARPRGRVGPEDILAQVNIAYFRRSPYVDYPYEVHIETLALCNAACTFCPYPTMDRQGDRMSDELIEKIITDLKKIPAGVPFFIAPFKVNEPFLDKRIFAVCARINEQLPNAQLRLFSNGSPLTKENLEKVGAIKRVAHLWISLNEVEAAAYEKLMRLPLDRTLANLDILHEMVAGGRFLHPVMVSRVTDGTPRDPEFLGFIRQRYPRFNPFLISANNWTGQVEAGADRPVPPSGCVRWFELSIMASGKVALCCMDGEGKHVLGDVSSQAVLDVYNSPEYRKMRQFTFSRKDVAAPCNKCAY